MSVFVILSVGDSSSALEERINTTFGENSKFLIKDGMWLVTYDGVTHVLAEKLGIRAGEVEPAVVFLVGNYSGRGSPDIWDWLGERLPVRAG
jgi:hypothetical protein